MKSHGIEQLCLREPSGGGFICRSTPRKVHEPGPLQGLTGRESSSRDVGTNLKCEAEDPEVRVGQKAQAL